MALLPISAEAISPFATLLRAKDGKPGEIAPVLETGDVPGRHAFSILCPQPVPPDAITLRFLERHPHSTQSFLPITVGRWLVCLAPTLPHGTPDLANLRAFVAGPEDAICIGRDVWHAGLTVLDRPAEVGMIMWKSEAGDDGVVFDLPTPIVLSA
jgi:ureidoglycolate lyase